MLMAFLDCHVFCQGIADIDQQDSDNPQLCAEYAPFMYGYLRQLERQLAIRQDFLKVSLTAAALAPAVGSVSFTYVYLRQLERQLKH